MTDPVQLDPLTAEQVQLALSLVAHYHHRYRFTEDRIEGWTAAALQLSQDLISYALVTESVAELARIIPDRYGHEKAHKPAALVASGADTDALVTLGRVLAGLNAARVLIVVAALGYEACNRRVAQQ